MLGVALLGLLANIVVYRILHSEAEDNINVAAARLHVLGDLLGSIGAMVAAIVIIKTGWTPIDPLLSVFVALLIVRSAWSVLRKSTLILMENAPETVNPDDLKQTLIAAVPGVRDVHDVHCWSLTTGQTMLTLHLVLEVEADPSRVLREAKHVLAQRFEVSHSALQLESEECPDAV